MREKAIGVSVALVLAFVFRALLTGPSATAQDTPLALPPNALPVPIVVQATTYSCGAGALLSVLYYWHAYDGVETQLYAELGTTEKDGTEPPKLAEVAQKHGLAAKLQTMLTFDDLRAGLARGDTIILDIQSGPSNQTPWKDRWEDGHYVVLVAMDDTNAYFMDPSTENSYEYAPLPELLERWHDYENRNGSDQRYVQAGVFIHGSRPLAAFPSPLVRLGGAVRAHRIDVAPVSD